MKSHHSALLAAAFLAPCALLADYAKEFNVKFAGYTGTTTLTNFPALIRLSDARNRFDYSKCKKSNGDDVRFFDANGNLLPCEVDTWNPDGESLIWVSVPELTKDTVITVRYGNADAPAVTATDVWTNGYAAVWHMNAAAESRSQTDATANGKAVTCPSEYATAVQSGVGGKIGLAARCGLRSDNLGGFSISGSGYFDGWGELTVEAWTFRDVGAETPSYNATIIDYSRYSSGWLNGWSMYEQKNNEKIGFWFYKSIENDQGTWMSAPSATPTQGEWHYHARAWSGTTGVTLRTLDATTDSSGSAPATPQTLRSIENSTLCIGNRSANSNGTTPFHGVIDEVRVSNVFRSKDWAEASYATVAVDGFAVYETQNDWAQYAHKFSVSFPGVPEGATLADFPVLVKVSTNGISGFSYADCAKGNGADIRFADANGTLLPCEVESWDTNGISTIWVKVPELTANTRISGYYGWPLAPAVSPTDVWDEHYRAVWHMNAVDGSRSQKDSTSNGKTVTCPANYASGVQSGVEGKVGLAARCGLRSDNCGGFGISDSGYFDGYGEITVETWTFRDAGAEISPDYVGTIIEKSRRSSNWAYAWSMYEQKNSEKVGFWLYSGANAGGLWLTAPSDIPTQGEWHYHARRWSGTTGVNSRTLDASTTSSNPAPPATPDSLSTVSDGILCIGNCTTLALTPNTLNTPFHGVIDEVRISDVARSDAWVKATHDTIAENGTFTSYGVAGDNTLCTVVLFR